MSFLIRSIPFYDQHPSTIFLDEFLASLKMWRPKLSSADFLSVGLCCIRNKVTQNYTPNDTRLARAGLLQVPFRVSSSSSWTYIYRLHRGEHRAAGKTTVCNALLYSRFTSAYHLMVFGFANDTNHGVHLAPSCTRESRKRTSFTQQNSAKLTPAVSRKNHSAKTNSLERYRTKPPLACLSYRKRFARHIKSPILNVPFSPHP